MISIVNSTIPCKPFELTPNPNKRGLNTRYPRVNKYIQD